MLTEAIQAAIEAEIETTNPDVFIVEISLKRGKQSLLSVKVDTDPGISLSECTALSRKIGYMLDQRPDLEFAYRLEVSSPGVGSPLKLHRQYLQNVGRNLQITTEAGLTRVGKLLEVTEEGITLEWVRKVAKKGQKPRKLTPEEAKVAVQTVLFDVIKEAKVVIL